MAQMAAQDYFSRLQMSGMVHPDMANFSQLGALNSFHNNSSMAPSSGNKHNLKRKEKASNQDEYGRSSSSKEVRTRGTADYLRCLLILYLFLAFKDVKCQSINAQYHKSSEAASRNVSRCRFNEFCEGRI